MARRVSRKIALPKSHLWKIQKSLIGRIFARIASGLSHRFDGECSNYHSFTIFLLQGETFMCASAVPIVISPDSSHRV